MKRSDSLHLINEPVGASEKRNLRVLMLAHSTILISLKTIGRS
ncbi:hypothetical protein [Oenococcus oeni]|nr:hypothetical protein [Oenococcus oeni]